MSHKNIFWVIIVIGSLVIAGCFVFVFVKAKEINQQQEAERQRAEEEKLLGEVLFDSLISNGVNVYKIRIDEKVIYASVYAANDTALGAVDIITLRTVRNTIRSLSMKESALFRDISAMNNVFVDSNGTIMYDATIMDCFTIPEEFTESLRIRDETPEWTLEKTKASLQEQFIKEEVHVEIQEASLLQQGGYYILMKANLANASSDVFEINLMMQTVRRIIDGLNAEGCSIGEYRIMVADSANSELVYLLDADLIYSDFLWWQAPSLGVETWTESTPQLQ